MSHPWRAALLLVSAAALALLIGAASSGFLAPATSHPSVGGFPVGPQRCIGTNATNSYLDEPEECARLTTFARQLLDRNAHGPVTSVAVYQEPPSDILQTYSGWHDFAIVSFSLGASEEAFYVRCGAGTSETICFDLRPLKPGFTMQDHAQDGRAYDVP